MFYLQNIALYCIAFYNSQLLNTITTSLIQNDYWWFSRTVKEYALFWNEIKLEWTKQDFQYNYFRFIVSYS